MRLKTGKAICELTSLPGCAQIVVSHNVFVPLELRKQGYGTEAHSIRLEIIEDLGYDYAICTVDAENEAERKILQRNNWCLLDTFVSNKSNKYIYLYGRRIS